MAITYSVAHTLPHNIYVKILWVEVDETAASLRSSIRLEVSEFVKIIIKYQVPNKRAE